MFNVLHAYLDNLVKWCVDIALEREAENAVEDHIKI